MGTVGIFNKSVTTMPRLNLDALEKGRGHRIAVELSQDALGRAQSLPLIVVRGTRPGPVFGVTCAIHGNEINGIPVIHKLIEKLEPAKLRGTVVAVPIVNMPGFARHQRVYRDGVDLNHMMPGEPEGNESEVFAYRFFDRIVTNFNFLVDLHTASFGRVNSLYVRADMSEATTARMAKLQRPQIILHNPPSDSTLRGAAAEIGIAAITVEIGDPQVFQPRHMRPALIGIRAVMAELGMTAKRKVVPGPEPLICDKSQWMFTTHGGFLEVFPEVARLVAKGETIAIQRDIFGELVAEYQAPYAGVVIGKSRNPVSPTGARILHLGRLSQNSEAALGGHSQ